ncbi:MAG TPA: hypothetical protein VGH86_18150 [Phenylobacterium sp.]
MSVSLVRGQSPRSLPARPNLEFLKNEAKQRLRALRTTAPSVRLADVQHHLAREYGFANWRELKAGVERLAPPALSGLVCAAVGDWIALGAGAPRIALHIAAAGAGVAVSVDICDHSVFGVPADGVALEGDSLSFTLLAPTANGFQQSFYQARWDVSTDRWVGAWTSHGITADLDFVRGAYSPAPRFDGLDGFWDGRLESQGRPIRLILRFRTSEHGTHAWLDSPDTGVLGRPAASISRDGREVTIAMKTVAITGTISDDGEWIEGLFVRNGPGRPLTLVRRPPGGAPPLPQRAPAVELTPEALVGLVGDYLTELKSVVQITQDDGRLHVQFIGSVADPTAGGPDVATVRGPKLELVASSPIKFFWRVLDATAEFELGPDGRAVAMVTRQNGRQFRAVRVA